MNDGELDIGHGHTIRYTSWKPDRELNPQYADRPDIDRLGIIINHPKGDQDTGAWPGDRCKGFVTFDVPGAAELDPNRARWTVESWEPLTISPSVLCRLCGDHGFIRDGGWVPA